MILIFAGNAYQAHVFARKKGLPINSYLTPHASRGHEDPVVFLVGTYRDRPDFKEIMAALAPARPTFLNERGKPVEP